MTQTPAALAERILRAIEPVLPMPLTESRETDIVNAIIGVINPLCNEVARLELSANPAEDPLRKLAEAVVEAWETEPELTTMYTSERLDHVIEELTAHIRNGGTNG